MVGDGHGSACEVCDVAGGDRATVNYLKRARAAERGHGEVVVVASKVFIYEGEAGGSAVNQGASLDVGVTEREGARDY